MWKAGHPTRSKAEEGDRAGKSVREVGEGHSAHLVCHGKSWHHSNHGEEPTNALKLGTEHGLIYFCQQLLWLLCGMWWQGASMSERDQMGGFDSTER